MDNKKTQEPENKDFIVLVVDDVEYKTLTNKMHERRKPYEPLNPALIRSFMPGNIQEIFLKEGDEVKEGDSILILEAMKMKNLLKAPFSGKIKKINVKVGEIVSKNHILAELE